MEAVRELEILAKKFRVKRNQYSSRLIEFRRLSGRFNTGVERTENLDEGMVTEVTDAFEYSKATYEEGDADYIGVEEVVYSFLAKIPLLGNETEIPLETVEEMILHMTTLLKDLEEDTESIDIALVHARTCEGIFKKADIPG